MTNPDIGTKPKPQQKNPGFVMMDRAPLEEWNGLIYRQPTAGQVLAILVSNMGHQNALVISHGVLAKMTRRSVATVKRALDLLQAERWIQAVAIGKGKEKAYVVNSRVAWGESRKQLVLSKFDAAVIVSREDQSELALDDMPLRQIPTVYAGERPVPHGPGAEPPAQTIFDGMEPDLPTRDRPDGTGQHDDIGRFLGHDEGEAK